MSMLGVILLAGIVAKNATLLIDVTTWSQQDCCCLTHLIEAGAIRQRPILMTTFALTAALLPLALGREGGRFRVPLAITVTGGVITSALLTLLVIPTVYEILDEACARGGELVWSEAEAGDGGASKGRG